MLMLFYADVISSLILPPPPFRHATPLLRFFATMPCHYYFRHYFRCFRCRFFVPVAMLLIITPLCDIEMLSPDVSRATRGHMLFIDYAAITLPLLLTH